MNRTIPLPRQDVETVRARLVRHGSKALSHLDGLRRPVRCAEYRADYTLRRLIYRGLVLVIPYLGVDHYVNAAAVNVALREEGI